MVDERVGLDVADNSFDLSFGSRLANGGCSGRGVVILAEHLVLIGKANVLVGAMTGHQRTGIVADDVSMARCRNNERPPQCCRASLSASHARMP